VRGPVRGRWQKANPGRPRDAKSWTFVTKAARLPKGDPINSFPRTVATLGTVAVFAGALVFGLVPVPALAASPAESCFFAAINAARASSGLPALTADATLAGIAGNWAATMASQGILEHNPDLNNAIPMSWGVLGENVGRGPGCTAIAQAFIQSPEHRANILDASYSAVGVGVVIAGTGDMYVTEDFAGQWRGPEGLPTAAPPDTAAPPGAAAPPTPAPPATAASTVPSAASTPVAPPAAPAPARLMIEAVSTIGPAGAVVPVSSSAGPPPSQTDVRTAAAHRPTRARRRRGVLNCLGRLFRRLL
jgi:uncharacterized protein YkwD